MKTEILDFEKWCKFKGIDTKALTGDDWVYAKKEYNIYKLRAEKLVDKIVNK